MDSRSAVLFVPATTSPRSHATQGSAPPRTGRGRGQTRAVDRIVAIACGARFDAAWALLPVFRDTAAAAFYDIEARTVVFGN